MQFVVAVLTDALARANAWVNSLLGDKVANDTSLKIMQHAAALDLEKNLKMRSSTTNSNEHASKQAIESP